MSIDIIRATSTEDIQAVKQLFQDYASWLPVDLEFQGFSQEMASFPGNYDVLLLAKNKGQPIGAVGLRPHKGDTCEMKRLFVAPGLQNKGTGQALCERLIEEARQFGYRYMILDTLTRLTPAIALYKKLGFTEIEPYNENPEADVTYMGKSL